MNWSELKQKITPYVEKATPYVEKAKVYGEKALDFTQKQVQNTPIVLKNIDEYTECLLKKRFILIIYDENDVKAQELYLLFPLWSTYAWTDNATIRFCSKALAPELVQHIGSITPVDMRVYCDGNQVFQAQETESIKNWWKDRKYAIIDTQDTKSEVSPSKTVDPLDSNKS